MIVISDTSLNLQTYRVIKLKISQIPIEYYRLLVRSDLSYLSVNKWKKKQTIQIERTEVDFGRSSVRTIDDYVDTSFLHHMVLNTKSTL